MKRIIAVFLSVTLLLATCPIGVYAAWGDEYFTYRSWSKRTIKTDKWNKFQPVSKKAGWKAPKKSTPQTPTPEAPVPEAPVPETPVPETPVPEAPVPETPVPETPAPEIPAPETPVPETPVPETPVPETPAPEIPVPEIVNEDVVSLIAPPKGLTPAKGDGSDETKVIQAIFDYATSAHKTILIPEGYTFVVDQILIYKQDNFGIKGYGTLKHKSKASKAMLSISVCNDFIIEELNTDGNVVGNETTRGRRLDESEDLHSVEIVWSQDFSIGRMTDKNPAADSLYLNDVAHGRIDTLIAYSEGGPCGRNGLSIIKAEDITIDRVDVNNIGVEGMPSGIDLEPNRITDDIRNVVIKSAKVVTAHGAGIAATSQWGSAIEDIEINGEVTKTGGGSYVFMLDAVKNFKGRLKLVQVGTPTSYGARISRCENITADLEIVNAINGIDLGVESSRVYLTGKITDTFGDGISIWKGLTNSSIDMDITNAGKDGEHGVIQISEYGSIDNVVFKGDYSYSGTGKYCFLVDGVATNCSTEGVIANGWPLAKLKIGDSVAIFNWNPAA